MTARLKNWGGIDNARRSWDVRRRDGREARQVRFIVRAPNRAAVAAALGAGWSAYAVGKYVHDSVGDASPLDDHPPGTVLIAPLDPGDTIAGTTGWRPRP